MAVPERFFTKFSGVPEWGIVYPDGKMLLLEFCTRSNFFYSGLMRGKLSAYQRTLEKIEERFQAKAIVVFVLDVPRPVVEGYVGSLHGAAGSVADAPLGGGYSPLTPFYFVDYETFLKVPIGEQLKAAIYYWHDGKSYPLSKHD
jgi:hypothetical protein